MTVEQVVTRPPMWCDDFDMDLLKVLPEVERLLKPLAGIRLYTTCHPTYGRVNLPSSWNTRHGLCCFVGFLREGEPLPDQGAQPEVYDTDAPVVEATAEEMFRDLWSHQTRWVQVLGSDFAGRWDHFAEVWRPSQLYVAFDALMDDLRGIWVMEECEKRAHRRKALRSIDEAARRLVRLHQVFLKGTPVPKSLSLPPQSHPEFILNPTPWGTELQFPGFGNMLVSNRETYRFEILGDCDFECPFRDE